MIVTVDVFAVLIVELRLPAYLLPFNFVAEDSLVRPYAIIDRISKLNDINR